MFPISFNIIREVIDQNFSVAMLIDSFAPDPDAVETHFIDINASPEVVYRALWTADLGGSPAIKILLALRSLPEFAAHPRRSLPQTRQITLQTLIDAGFGLLVEQPGKEIVLGVSGKFWRPTGNLSTFNRADFDEPVADGLARAVWNFHVEGRNDRTILSTETRVTCGGNSSRRKFRAYWLFVRPFSGLIRRIMLKNVRRAAGR
ncbi:MAG TPA: hypothetical protein VLQ90_08730 [Pyrinomonadaceae bacterium]|nr:hypothetical protein [Pyrinomonadaceae bacterium]